MKKFVLILLAVTLAAPVFARDVNAFVDVAWLDANLNNPRLVVLDIRAVDAYRTAHIPGAVSSVAATWYPKRGILTAEVPQTDELTDLIQEAGIDANSIVVVVNAEGGAMYHVSARVAFTLKYAGLDNIAILDGGMSEWTKAGKATRAGMENRKATSYKPTLRTNLLVSMDYVVQNVNKSQFMDARSYDIYFGRSKTAFPTQFGHIPGAFPTPKEWLYDADGKLVSKTQIETILAGKRIDPNKEVIGYCDTGMGCAIWTWVLSEYLGWKNVKMYDGSCEELTRASDFKLVQYVWR
jgi:thiosulfate/3-mercaptopyruvate sulfurtransferase